MDVFPSMREMKSSLAIKGLPSEHPETASPSDMYQFLTLRVIRHIRKMISNASKSVRVHA